MRKMRVKLQMPMRKDQPLSQWQKGNHSRLVPLGRPTRISSYAIAEFNSLPKSLADIDNQLPTLHSMMPIPPRYTD